MKKTLNLIALVILCMTSIFILSSCDKDNTVNSKNLEGIWALHHITLYDGTSQEIDYKNPTTGCALYTFKKTGKDEFSMRIFTCYNANYDGSKPEYYWVGAPSMSTHVSDNKIQVAGVEMGDIKKLTSKGLTIKNQQMTMEMEKLSNNPDEIKKIHQSDNGGVTCHYGLQIDSSHLSIYQN